MEKAMAYGVTMAMVTLILIVKSMKMGMGMGMGMVPAAFAPQGQRQTEDVPERPQDH